MVPQPSSHSCLCEVGTGLKPHLTSGLHREIPWELECSTGDPNTLPGLLGTCNKPPNHCEESSAFPKTSATARAGAGCEHHLQKPLPNLRERQHVAVTTPSERKTIKTPKSKFWSAAEHYLSFCYIQSTVKRSQAGAAGQEEGI